MSEALILHEILERICFFLSSDDLKVDRLVKRQFNTEACRILSQRGFSHPLQIHCSEDKIWRIRRYHILSVNNLKLEHHNRNFGLKTSKEFLTIMRSLPLEPKMFLNNFTVVGGINDNHVMMLLEESGPTIKTLILNGTYPGSSLTLDDILMMVPNVRKLAIDLESYPGGVCTLARLNQLKILHIDGRVSDIKVIDSIVHRSPKLSNVSLSSRSSIDFKKIQYRTLIKEVGSICNHSNFAMAASEISGLVVMNIKEEIVHYLPLLLQSSTTLKALSISSSVDIRNLPEMVVLDELELVFYKDSRFNFTEAALKFPNLKNMKITWKLEAPATGDFQEYFIVSPHNPLRAVEKFSADICPSMEWMRELAVLLPNVKCVQASGKVDLPSWKEWFEIFFRLESVKIVMDNNVCVKFTSKDIFNQKVHQCLQNAKEAALTQRLMFTRGLLPEPTIFRFN